jgi:error-prone DNA polymerase
VNGTYGAVEHERACRDYGLRPLIGAEVSVDGANLVLIAREQSGYASLCQLLTSMHSVNRLHPCVSLDALEGLDPSVVILTGGREGRATRLAEERRSSELQAWLHTLRSYAAGPLYVELNDYDRPGWRAVLEQLYTAAQHVGLPAIVGSDVRYATADKYAVYDAMTCIRLGISVFDAHSERPVNDAQCLKRSAELRSRIPYDDAFHHVSVLAAQCNVSILSSEIEPPKARIQPETQPSEELQRLCDEAFAERYVGTDIEDIARHQLRHELSVIHDLGLCDFFLVVHEVVVEAKRRRIRTSGRGSAANSIVAYLLGITGVCPIRHNLLFERFLHKGRKGTPDIDVDFDSDRRSEIIAWMEERFGQDHTAMTATLITYRLRMAVRDVAKALGWPNDIATRMSKSIPSYTNRPVKHYEQALLDVVGNAPLLRTLITMVEHLEGCPRHLGQHSGGMILSQRPLWERTPVQCSANGVTVVQFDKDDVEAMGLVKFDVLGLRMLACISEAIEQIEMATGQRIDIDAITLDDPAVYEMMRQGRTLGVFQIESQGQMHLLAQHQPECFNDLVTEVALFRPGPLQGGMVHPYILSCSPIFRTV